VLSIKLASLHPHEEKLEPHRIAGTFFELDAAVEMGFRWTEVAHHPSCPGCEEMNIGAPRPDSQAEPEAVPCFRWTVFL
jgi:hypothetical protein